MREAASAKIIVHIAARLADQKDPGETIPRIDMMLDIAIASTGRDISERKRAGACAKWRSARPCDTAQEVDIIVAARPHVPANLDCGAGERTRRRCAHEPAVESCAGAAPASEQFVADRIVNDADLDLVGGHAGD